VKKAYPRALLSCKPWRCGCTLWYHPYLFGASVFKLYLTSYVMQQLAPDCFDSLDLNMSDLFYMEPLHHFTIISCPWPC